MSYRDPISSSDPQAVEKLQQKIEAAERLQVIMTAANKIVRKHKANPESGKQSLIDLGLSESIAIKLFHPDYAGRIGFPSYELTNNNANIRRMKQRIEELTAEVKTREMAPTETIPTPDGVRIVENESIDRLQIIFPGKPAQAVRDSLKSNGFHWSPTEGAWQRQLNSNARWAAKRIIEPMMQQAVKAELKEPTHYNTATDGNGTVIGHEPAWLVDTGSVDNRRCWWYTDAAGERYYTFEPLPAWITRPGQEDENDDYTPTNYFDASGKVVESL